MGSSKKKDDATADKAEATPDKSAEAVADQPSEGAAEKTTAAAPAKEAKAEPKGDNEPRTLDEWAEDYPLKAWQTAALRVMKKWALDRKVERKELEAALKALVTKPAAEV